MVDENSPTEPPPPPPLPDHWDPNPAERSWHQNRVTGDFGWLVRREGKDAIKLDRAGVDEIRTFEPGEWMPKADVRPLQMAQLAQIAFTADKQYCTATGDYKRSKTDWLSLSQEQRRAWIEKGPQSDPVRKALYEAIMGALRHLAG